MTPELDTKTPAQLAEDIATVKEHEGALLRQAYAALRLRMLLQAKLDLLTEAGELLEVEKGAAGEVEKEKGKAATPSP